MTTGELRIGVDLGGTKIEAIGLDASGNIFSRPRLPTPRGDYDATIVTIRELVSAVEQEAGRTGTVGIGIPGALSLRTGLVKNANSLWLNGKPLKSDLEKALRMPVRLANDANCFAVSEATDGAAAGLPVVFGVILGTGVGGGIAFSGKTHVGLNAIAGEWGHTPLPWPTTDEKEGQLCYCGHHGCIETWLCGPAAKAEFTRLSGHASDMAEIDKAARAGDKQANNYQARYAERLGRALAVVVDILDPDAVVLGGGVSNLDFLYDAVPSSLSRHCFSDGVSTPILKSRHGDSSGVRGAAWLWND